MLKGLTKKEKENTQAIINKWKEITHQTATLYPRNRIISINGFKELEVSKAIQLMFKDIYN